MQLADYSPASIAACEVVSQESLGWNRQIYQRLKLALELGLRRQIFIAVCDDRSLRDRLAARLHAELRQSAVTPPGTPSGLDSPTFFSFSLAANDPNPLMAIEQRVRRYAAQKRHRSAMEGLGFQIIGVERLTRQSATVQWRFLSYLRQLPRHPVAAVSSVLLWVPRPWLNSIQQSAPEFWQHCTRLFEFIGEPTPIVETDTADEFGTQVPQRDDRVYPREDTEAIADDIVLPGESTELPLDWTRDRPLPVEAGSLQSELDFNAKSDAEVFEYISAVGGGLSDPPPVVASFQHLNPELADGVTATGEPEARSHLLQLDRLHGNGAVAADLAEEYQRLGDFYRDRIEQGNASLPYLHVAILAYECALDCMAADCDRRPAILNDVGTLCWMSSRSQATAEEKIACFDRAIAAYRDALDLTPAAASPQSHAMIQNNLGAVYGELARYRDGADNLARSIEAFEAALPYRRADIDPQAFVATQNNLGTAHWNLAQYREPTNHLQRAIEAYNEALGAIAIEDIDANPSHALNFAMLQNNLGTAYWNLAQHDPREDRLLLAISAYRSALMYRTPDTTPAACAATQNNLGTAYWHLADREREGTEARAEFLQQAIAAYETAIQLAEQVRSNPNSAPLAFDVCAAHNNLGLAHYQLVTPPCEPRDNAALLEHLEASLHHHLKALEGWQQGDRYQMALSFVLQVIRTLYDRGGIQGQNKAFSMLPGHLLPEVMRQL